MIDSILPSRFYCLIFTLAFALWADPALAASPKGVRQLLEVSSCIDKAWPNWSGLRAQAMVINGNINNNPYIIMESDWYSDLSWGQLANRLHHQFTTLDGVGVWRDFNINQHVVSIDLLNAERRVPVHVFLHELFHFSVQRRFVSKPVHRFRSFSLSHSYSAEYDKLKELLDRLLLKSRGNLCDPRFQAHAKILLSQDPKLKESSWELERLEGAAEYAGVRAFAIYASSCSVSDEQRADIAWDFYRKEFYPRFRQTIEKKSIEWMAYTIGVVSGFWLDKCGSDERWHQKIESGRTFLELVAEAGER